MYSNRVPNLYVDLIYRLFLLEVVDDEIDDEFKKKYTEALESS
jgi:hypothetical protein